MPDIILERIRDADRPDDVALLDEWLATPRKRWGVSGEVILRRLLDSGRLTKAQYFDYRKWRSHVQATESEGGTRMYRHRVPKHVFGDTFVRTVLDALNARHLTLAKANTYLDNLQINDLHRLERHYAGL